MSWRNVTRKQKCPICGKTDWCSLSEDGLWAMCRRVDRGDGVHRQDGAGSDYWLYPLGEDVTAEPPESEAASKKTPCADIEVRNNVYRWVLDRLTLTPQHRADLVKRGMPVEQITRRGYKSYSLQGRKEACKTAIERFGSDTLLTVPGFARGQDHLSIFMAGSVGMVIPVLDVGGHITALKIRSDGGPGAKYTYLSSAKYGGPSPGAAVHVPMGTVAPAASVRVTEGELKADVATSLSGMPTISVPGVQAWAAATPVLKALEAGTVRLAFDADWRANQIVRRALRAAAAAWCQAGFVVEIELWPADRGKGIDDLLASGGSTRVELWEGVGQVVTGTDIEVLKATVYQSSSPIVELAVDGGHLVRVDLETLMSPHRFSVKFAEATLRPPLMPSGKNAAEDWRMIITGWLAKAERIDQTAEADNDQTLAQNLEYMLDGLSISDDSADLDKGAKLLIDGLEIVKVRPIEQAIRAHVAGRLTRNEICLQLRKLGWEPLAKKISGKTERVWALKQSAGTEEAVDNGNNSNYPIRETANDLPF